MEETGRLELNTPTSSPSSSATRVRSEAVQSSWPRRKSSSRAFRRERTPLSRFLNSGIRQLPRQFMPRRIVPSTGVSESYTSDQTQQETESSGQQVVTESLSSLPNHFPALIVPFPSLSVVVTSPTTSTPNNSPPPRPTALPEGPPSRSPLPPEWSYSDPSEDSSNRASFLVASATSSPLHSPSGEQTVITPNPSYSASRTRSPPASRRPLLSGLSNLGRRRSRSPLLGISALNTGANKASQYSLDWDNYASSPTYFRKTIPVLSTPSTSLDSSPERIGTPVSVIMTRRCSKCHRYIAGAPTADLEHVGKYGPDCESEHHPNPCDYSSRDSGACTEYSSSVQPNQSQEQAKFGQVLHLEMLVVV